MARKNSSARSLLLELLLDIVIFAVCAAVCIQIFALSESTMMKSRAMTYFGLQTQTLASIYKSNDGDIDKTARYFKTEINDEGGFSLYYSNDLTEVTFGGDYAYELKCAVDQSAMDNNGVEKMNVKALWKEETLLDVNLSKFTKLGG
jgi:hypothetical protein